MVETLEAACETSGLGDVLPVEQHARAAGFELDDGLSGQLREPVHVGQADSGLESPQTHGPVHGAAVDVQKAQPQRQAPRDGALARPRRPVNRHHNALHHAPVPARLQ
jgi:hypothetical protein